MARAAARSPRTPAVLAHDTGPVAIYCRVSSDEQAERQTIQAQIDLLRDFCRFNGLTIAGEYLDEGVSGTIPLGERPEGRRLLADARDGRFSTVLVYRSDRLARKLTVLLAAYEELQFAGVAFRSATEPLDTSSPVGRFVFQLMGSLAELDRSTIIERMTLGRDRVARSGQWVTGRVPYGYEIDGERRLIPSQRPTPLGTEAEVVRQVAERIAAGSSLVAEARRLTLAGVPAVMRYPNGTERINPRGWQQSRLGAMLHNDGYASGRFVMESQFGPIEIDAPALVSPDVWQKARARLTVNRAMATRNSKRPYLLRGLIRCARCGRVFSGQVVYSKGRQYRYYRCGGTLPATEALPERRCKAPNISAEWLEAKVWEDIRAFILDPGPALAEAQAHVRERLSRASDLEGRRRELLATLRELDRGRDDILTLVRRGRLTLADAEGQLDANAAERAQVQAELDALRAQADLASALEAQVAEASVMLTRLRDQLDAIEAGGPDAKRPWVERLVARIIVDWEPPATPRGRVRPIVTVQYLFGEPAVPFADSDQYGQA